MTAQPRLIALDEDDLAVISAHVQDASVRAGDIIWRPGEKRLVVGMKRLDWDHALSGPPSARRFVTALRFDRVLACKARNFDMDKPDQTLDLIGLEFHSGKKPGGSVLLMFGGGQALRLDVECLECELADLGEDHLGTEDPDAAGPDGGIAADTDV